MIDKHFCYLVQLPVAGLLGPPPLPFGQVSSRCSWPHWCSSWAAWLLLPLADPAPGPSTSSQLSMDVYCAFTVATHRHTFRLEMTTANSASSLRKRPHQPRLTPATWTLLVARAKKQLVPGITDVSKVSGHEATNTSKINQALLTAAHLILFHIIYYALPSKLIFILHLTSDLVCCDHNCCSDQQRRRGI